jgi:FKBP-type peptidyl-prolyl cis-trans isomerase FklB
MGNLNTAPARLPRIITIIGLILALAMVVLLFANSGGGTTTSAVPTAASGAPAGSGGGNTSTAAGENCREIADADAPLQTTASGLQYQILRDCDGSSPTAASTVTVHYRGTLADGTQFDSSYDRGAPATFPLNGVIAGWTEGLQLMSVGERFRFIIPPELGYGAAGAGGAIPPNATLTFEVELISF